VAPRFIERPDVTQTVVVVRTVSLGLIWTVVCEQ